MNGFINTFFRIAMLVTSRLLWIISLLLYQKAKDEGEMFTEKDDVAKDQEAIAILSKIGEYEELNLPTGLKGLLERSHRLFIRAMRLSAL
jgi:regulator of CtrA degradation